ncbi:MAG TPA: YCF48-related protein [Vicinamibacterales bacterium]|nr:YCF48-related protein [Vicinamibacterales bacterium]
MTEVTPDCLDAETLAAWMDDGLPAAALAAAQAHVAGCARCQALVATMVRIDPPANAVSAAQSSRWWMSWLVPVAGAAAIIVWFAVAQRNPPTPAFEEQSKVAEAPAPSTPVPPPAAQAAAKTLSDQSPARDTAALSKERRQNAATKNEFSARSRQDELKDAKKKADVARQEALRQTAPAALDRVSQVIEVRSPNSAVRWRVSTAGVEKTIDGGATWSAQQLPVSAPLVAGVSPARNVCWLVGGNGVVLLTTDGQIWRRLAFPELTALVAVTATDAVSATVRTADGRDFVTKDAGITWIQRKLQDF